MKTLAVFAMTVALSFPALASHHEGGDHSHKHGDKSHKHGKRKGRMMKKFDTNGDNKISSDEWMAHFKKMDSNGDGSVTKEEMKAHKKAMKKKMKNS